VGEVKPPSCALRSENIMESGGTKRTRKGNRKVYRIVVGRELSARYAAAFEGMEMETGGGHTILTGELIDQPHLHGILDRISSLGLELLSVESWPEKHYDNEASYLPRTDHSRP
jgi:hypothetical protein